MQVKTEAQDLKIGQLISVAVSSKLVSYESRNDDDIADDDDDDDDDDDGGGGGVWWLQQQQEMSNLRKSLNAMFVNWAANIHWLASFDCALLVLASVVNSWGWWQWNNFISRWTSWHHPNASVSLAINYNPTLSLLPPPLASFTWLTSEWTRTRDKFVPQASFFLLNPLTLETGASTGSPLGWPHPFTFSVSFLLWLTLLANSLRIGFLLFIGLLFIYYFY